MIVGGNNNITHDMMYDTILERKCIYGNGRYMLSLYYIFEKNVYTIRHAMGAFGMAPMGSGSTKQCYCSIAGWSLESFFSLFTLAVHKTTSCRWRFSAVWRPAKGALYAIQYFCYPFMIHCWPIKIYEFKH